MKKSSSGKEGRRPDGYMGQDNFGKSPDKDTAYPSSLKPEKKAS